MCDSEESKGYRDQRRHRYVCRLLGWIFWLFLRISDLCFPRSLACLLPSLARLLPLLPSLARSLASLSLARTRASLRSLAEIDLTGQIAADSHGTRQISGVGGQLDFLHGASRSPGGVPIVCLPSTSSSGSSRIVPTLKPGTGVVTTRYHARWIVTEHGAVNLFGLNYIQRAQALISIAAPEHRGMLEQAAFERYKIRVWNP